MATIRLGLSVAQSLEQVADGAGSATAANNVEITIDQGTVVTEGAGTRIMTKNEVLLILEIFEQYIIRRNWP